MIERHRDPDELFGELAVLEMGTGDK